LEFRYSNLGNLGFEVFMEKRITIDQLKKIDDFRWEIPKGAISGMKVSVLIFASRDILEDVKDDLSFEQIANVATLPGIVGRAMAMPDIHQGYGFPIGGVAAFDAKEGIISPGGVGFDINCGVRLLATGLPLEVVRPRLNDLADALFREIPSGLGSRGQIKLSEKELEGLLKKGARWAVESGYGKEEDLKYLESSGELGVADPSKVSEKAKSRGFAQVGSLGSGNHFIEVQEVEEVFDQVTAEAFGIKKGEVVVLIHTGSRGLGHQVCTDYVNIMRRAMRKYNIVVPDIELACAPISSDEGQDYLRAMSAAANFAWGNRQMILHWTRCAFENIFGAAAKIKVVYDVAHNIAKIERHKISGQEREVVVHRKGATRAFPPGHPELAPEYQKTGQPVLIPGSMGSFSYILVGTQAAMIETFGSVCHGAGRRLSRHKVKKLHSFQEAFDILEKAGLVLRTASRGGVLEEMPEAYKDINEVVEVVVGAGIAKKVAKTKPLAVIKG